MTSLPPHLDGHVQLGRLLRGARGLVHAAVHVHRHGEDWGVDGAGLGQQAVLKPWPDLV